MQQQSMSEMATIMEQQPLQPAAPAPAPAAPTTPAAKQEHSRRTAPAKQQTQQQRSSAHLTVGVPTNSQAKNSTENKWTLIATRLVQALGQQQHQHQQQQQPTTATAPAAATTTSQHQQQQHKAHTRALQTPKEEEPQKEKQRRTQAHVKSTATIEKKRSTPATENSRDCGSSTTGSTSSPQSPPTHTGHTHTQQHHHRHFQQQQSDDDGRREMMVQSAPPLPPDEPRLVALLNQLNEALSLASEADLYGLKSTEYSVLLATLLAFPPSSEVTLLAARAVTNLIDAAPGMVRYLAPYVPAAAYATAAAAASTSAALSSQQNFDQQSVLSSLVRNLCTIEYMDIAEQSILALCRISRLRPRTVLMSGALPACLLYLDFFPMGMQRSALQTVALMLQGSRIPDAALDDVVNAIPSLVLRISGDLALSDMVCTAAVVQAFVNIVQARSEDRSFLERLASKDGFVESLIGILHHHARSIGVGGGGAGSAGSRNDPPGRLDRSGPSSDGEAPQESVSPASGRTSRNSMVALSPSPGPHGALVSPAGATAVVDYGSRSGTSLRQVSLMVLRIVSILLRSSCAITHKLVMARLDIILVRLAKCNGVQETYVSCLLSVCNDILPVASATERKLRISDATWSTDIGASASSAGQQMQGKDNADILSSRSLPTDATAAPVPGKVAEPGLGDVVAPLARSLMTMSTPVARWKSSSGGGSGDDISTPHSVASSVLSFMLQKNNESVESACNLKPSPIVCALPSRAGPVPLNPLVASLSQVPRAVKPVYDLRKSKISMFSTDSKVGGVVLRLLKLFVMVCKSAVSVSVRYSCASGFLRCLNVLAVPGFHGCDACMVRGEDMCSIVDDLLHVSDLPSMAVAIEIAEFFVSQWPRVFFDVFVKHGLHARFTELASGGSCGAPVQQAAASCNRMMDSHSDSRDDDNSQEAVVSSQGALGGPTMMISPCLKPLMESSVGSIRNSAINFLKTHCPPDLFRPSGLPMTCCECCTSNHGLASAPVLPLTKANGPSADVLLAVFKHGHVLLVLNVIALRLCELIGNGVDEELVQAEVHAAAAVPAKSCMDDFLSRDFVKSLTRMGHVTLLTTLKFILVDDLAVSRHELARSDILPCLLAYLASCSGTRGAREDEAKSHRALRGSLHQHVRPGASVSKMKPSDDEAVRNLKQRQRLFCAVFFDLPFIPDSCINEDFIEYVVSLASSFRSPPTNTSRRQRCAAGARLVVRLLEVLHHVEDFPVWSNYASGDHGLRALSMLLRPVSVRVFSKLKKDTNSFVSRAATAIASKKRNRGPFISSRGVDKPASGELQERARKRMKVEGRTEKVLKNDGCTSDAGTSSGANVRTASNSIDSSNLDGLEAVAKRRKLNDSQPASDRGADVRDALDASCPARDIVPKVNVVGAVKSDQSEETGMNKPLSKPFEASVRTEGAECDSSKQVHGATDHVPKHQRLVEIVDLKVDVFAPLRDVVDYIRSQITLCSYCEDELMSPMSSCGDNACKRCAIQDPLVRAAYDVSVPFDVVLYLDGNLLPLDTNLFRAVQRYHPVGAYNRARRGMPGFVSAMTEAMWRDGIDLRVRIIRRMDTDYGACRLRQGYQAIRRQCVLNASIINDVTRRNNGASSASSPEALLSSSFASLNDATANRRTSEVVIQLLRLCAHFSLNWQSFYPSVDLIELESDAVFWTFPFNDRNEPLLPMEHFVSQRLSNKLLAQMEDVFAVAGAGFPPWCAWTMQYCPRLFSRVSRDLFFRVTAFSPLSCVQNVLRHVQDRYAINRGSLSSEDDGEEIAGKWEELSRLWHGSGHCGYRFDIFGPRKQQQLATLDVDRLDVLSALRKWHNSKVATYGDRLRARFFGEAGVGIGPTLEFLSLASHELQKSSLGLWLHDDQVADEEDTESGDDSDLERMNDDTTKLPPARQVGGVDANHSSLAASTLLQGVLPMEDDGGPNNESEEMWRFAVLHCGNCSVVEVCTCSNHGCLLSREAVDGQWACHHGCVLSMEHVSCKHCWLSPPQCRDWSTWVLKKEAAEMLLDIFSHDGGAGSVGKCNEEENVIATWVLQCKSCFSVWPVTDGGELVVNRGGQCCVQLDENRMRACKQDVIFSANKAHVSVACKEEAIQRIPLTMSTSTVKSMFTAMSNTPHWRITSCRINDAEVGGRDEKLVSSRRSALDDNSSYVVCPGAGLFPQRTSAVHISERTARALDFELVGRMIGHSLLEGRLLDMPFSPTFFKVLSMAVKQRTEGMLVTQQKENELFDMSSIRSSEEAKKTEYCLLETTHVSHAIALRIYQSMVFFRGLKDKGDDDCGGELSLGLRDVLLNDSHVGRTLILLSKLARKYDLLRMQQNASDFENSRELWLDGCPVRDLGLDFTVPGADGKDELVAGQGDTPVTIYNLHEYISAVVRYFTVSGVSTAFESICVGLAKVCDPSALLCYSQHELSSLVCGSGANGNRVDLSLRTLRLYTVCRQGYTHKSETVRHLFEVLGELEPDQQRQFIKFVTGCPILPAGGLRSLSPRLSIVRVGSISSPQKGRTGMATRDARATSSSSLVATSAEALPLPSAMTCANFLKLPDYHNKELLRKKLLVSITEGGGSFLLS